MAFKFDTQDPASSAVSPEMEMLNDMQEFSEIKGEIESLMGELPEMDAIYDNLTASMQCLQNAKDKDEAVLALNIDHSIENLLGVAEDKITAKAAIEGLGLKLKYWWGKFTDWVKRVCRSIANFFRKLFGFAPKFSKEAEEVAKITKDNPEDVQKALDATKSMARDLADKLGAAFDEKGFNEGFVNGAKMAAEMAEAFKEMGKRLSSGQFDQGYVDNIRAKEKDIDNAIAACNASLGRLSTKNNESVESLVVVAATVAAVEANCKAITKDCSTNIPKWSKQVSDNSEKIERVISDSELARMSAEEIEEFYASGGKVEDPLLYKALVGLYKSIASGVSKLNSLCAKMLSKRMSVEQQYVNMAKKVVSQAS